MSPNADELADIVMQAIDTAFGPVLERMAGLQAQVAFLEKQQLLHGRDGQPGRDGLTVVGERGEKGLDGRHGLDGKDGAPGPQGVKGIDGSHGKDGAPGLNGKDGANGAPGLSITGPQGERGERGADGAPGPAGLDGKDGAPGIAGKDGAAAVFPDARLAALEVKLYRDDLTDEDVSATLMGLLAKDAALLQAPVVTLTSKRVVRDGKGRIERIDEVVQ